MEVEPNYYEYIEEDQEYPQRLYGLFYCDHCYNEWSSAYTWINYSQQCSLCLNEYFPYEIYELLKLQEEDEESYDNVEGEEQEDDLHHKQELCAKCKKFGDCRTVESNSKHTFRKVKNEKNKNRNQKYNEDGTYNHNYENDYYDEYYY
jgi:hypothetical protein